LPTPKPAGLALFIRWQASGRMPSFGLRQCRAETLWLWHANRSFIPARLIQSLLENH
jgi:hypothetical protein